jgi:transcriptional regulator
MADEDPPANLPARRSGARHRSGNENGKRVTANAQDLANKRIRALELRIQGWTYNRIAQELGVSYQVAYKYVTAPLKVREAELIPTMREIEAARLDAVLEEAFGTMEKKKGTELALKAADRVIRAVSTRAALFGLNAPVAVSLTEATPIADEIAQLIKAAEAANQRTRQQIIEGEVVEDGDRAA